MCMYSYKKIKPIILNIWRFHFTVFRSVELKLLNYSAKEANIVVLYVYIYVCVAISAQQPTADQIEYKI